MKIELNDPRITAFALGELKGDDAIEIARAVCTDAKVRAAVDEVRETAGLLICTLGGGESHLLTPGQREGIRSMGSSPVIEDISSAREKFWRKPAAVAVGVAAAVALMLYIAGDGGGPGKGEGDIPVKWDWAQVDMESLTAPAMDDPTTDPSTDPSTAPAGSDDFSDRTSVKAVSTAMSDAMRDDTVSYRRELRRRIDEMEADEIGSATGLPALESGSDLRWREVVSGQGLNVPLASGATSWPWIVRCIDGQQKLPVRRAVRIEEMVNHFRYRKPTMVRGGGLVADMEICRTPWNPDTVLLGVHVRAVHGADVVGAPAVLDLNPERVKRARLIGYARVKNVSAGTMAAGPSRASRSQGNYVIYELEEAHGTVGQVGDEELALATLVLGRAENAARLPVGRVVSWDRAGADLRFASVVSACGVLLSGDPAPGGLDAVRLASMVDSIEEQDSAALGGDRREALALFRRAADLLGAKPVE